MKHWSENGLQTTELWFCGIIEQYYILLYHPKVKLVAKAKGFLFSFFFWVRGKIKDLFGLTIVYINMDFWNNFV